MSRHDYLLSPVYTPEDRFCLLTVADSDHAFETLIRKFPPHLASFEIQQLIRRETNCLQQLQGNGAPTLKDNTGERHLNLQSKTQRSLADIQPDTLTPLQRIKIAAALAKAVSEVHRHNLIHLAIRPGIFRLNQALDYAELLDFTSAEPLSDETPGINASRPHLACPHYLAPEQGHQFTHTLDTRTDLYSLGIVFYWLMEGSPPFIQNEQVEEISYAHIALDVPQPTALADASHTAHCQALFRVTETLLSKEPAQRYQSATALYKDLDYLLHTPPEQLDQFQPAQDNVPDRLFIPDKLYGRDAETHALLEAFHRVEQGPSEAMLVAGYSGVGKSSLIHKIRTPILRSNGLFIWGKFDQYQSASPYSAIAQAFNRFIRNLMTLPAEQVNHWRETLNTTLHPNAQVLIDVVPELGRLLGPQQPPSPLGPDEQQNRFNATFLQFVNTVCTRHKPLVIFIDDLQWADRASINLLRLLLSDEDSQYCLVIGAYRDNEVDTRHPFMQMLNGLEQEHIQHISLQPLQPRDLEALIADTLQQPQTQVQPLAALVHEKTLGNPFFFRQFLQELAQAGLLRFSHRQQRWLWTMDAIKQREITDNVVTLMVGKINRLPPRTQTLLQQAACIGASFDRTLIEAMHPGDECEHALQAALSAGLLYAETQQTAEAEGHSQPNRLRFLHDRVQQAAYSLIKPDDRPLLHHRIGCLLLDNTSQDDWPEHSYTLLTHLNKAHALLTPDETQTVAQLNLIAAERSRDATAYALAVDYLDNFFRLHGAVTQKSDPKGKDQTLHAGLMRLECLYLAGEYDEAEQYKASLQTRCSEQDDRIRLQTILITQYTRFGELDRAIAEGLKGLEQLGNPLPANPDMDTVGMTIGQVQQLLQDHPFATLAEQPAIEDPRILAILELLMAMQPCCYNSGSLLFPLTILELLRLTITEGNSTHSSYVFTMYALLCTKVLKDYPTAFEAEQYSRVVGKHFPANPLVEGRLRMMRANFILPWQKALKISSEERVQAYHACLEQGDYYWGVHAHIFGFYADLLCTENLDTLGQTTQALVTTCRKIKQPSQVYVSQLQCNLLDSLQGKLSHQHNLDHQPGYEAEALSHYQATNYMCGKYDRMLGRLVQGYLFGNYQQAIEIALSEDLTPADLDEGIFHEFFYTVFNALSLLALQQNDVPLTQHQERWLNTALSRIQQWETLNPETFEPAARLIDAERAVISARVSNVCALYESAIEAAEYAAFPLLQALANERMGHFRARRGQIGLSQAYIEESARLYSAWGAHAKAADLQHYLRTLTQTDQISTAANIDWNTVIRASQQLSRPLDPNALQQQLIERITHVTGAQIVSLYRFESGPGWTLTASNQHHENANDRQHSIGPESVLNYCMHSAASLLIKDACHEGGYILDPYITQVKTRSLLGLPMILDGIPQGVVLLEHRTTPGLFTTHQASVVELLLAQYLISDSNTQLYQQLESQNLRLEEEVSARTQELQRKTEHLEAILNALPLPYAVTRKDGSLIETNALFRNLFGLQQSSADSMDKGINVLDLYDSALDRQRLLNSLQEPGDIAHIECELKHPQGHAFWAQFSSTLLQLKSDEVIFSAISDISERIAKEQLLHKQATTDPLTSILNRRGFLQLANDLYSRGHHSQCILAMLDLDHFKDLNDTFGHSAGDEVLRCITTIVNQRLRDTDLFGRIGGEEFVIVLSEVTYQQAQVILERIRHEIAATHYRYKDKVISVTASIGATRWKAEETVEQVQERADRALYQAKDSGRNQTVLLQTNAD